MSWAKGIDLGRHVLVELKRRLPRMRRALAHPNPLLEDAELQILFFRAAISTHPIYPDPAGRPRASATASGGDRALLAQRSSLVRVWGARLSQPRKSLPFMVRMEGASMWQPPAGAS